MGRQKHFMFQNRYFISAIKFSLLLENPNNMAKSVSQIIKDHNLDPNFQWRFQKVQNGNEIGNLKLDLSKINIAANPSAEQEWIVIDPKVISVMREMVNEGLNDEEISGKIYTNILKEGYKMENNKLVEINTNEIAECNVVIDGGNYNLKAKYEENKITLTSKIFKNSIANLPNLEWVKCKDKKIYIGTENGVYLGEYDKVAKFKDVKMQILYAIDKVINTEEEIYTVNLGYLLPISQINRASSIIDELQGQDFEFETQNGNRIITIKTVSILPEGFASSRLFTEKEETLLYLDNETILIDFGSRTANIVSFNDGDITNADTLEVGSFNLYTAIQNDLKNNKGKDKSIEKIATAFEKGKLKVEDNLLIDYLNEIKEELHSYNKDLEDYDNIIMTGGVSLLLQNNKLSDGITTLLDKLIEMLGIDKNKVHVLDNADQSNIDGAMLLLNDLVNKGE